MIYYLIHYFLTARVPLPKLGLWAGPCKHDLLPDILILDHPSAPVKTGALRRGLQT